MMSNLFTENFHTKLLYSRSTILFREVTRERVSLQLNLLIGVCFYGSVFTSFGPLSKVVDPYRAFVLFYVTSLSFLSKCNGRSEKGVNGLSCRTSVYGRCTTILFLHSQSETESGVVTRTVSFWVVVSLGVSGSVVRS